MKPFSSEKVPTSFVSAGAAEDPNTKLCADPPAWVGKSAGVLPTILGISFLEKRDDLVITNLKES
jgi:hypothetical protein